MWKIIKALACIFIGVVGAHAGHFVYQKYYLKDFAGKKFSESIATIPEKLLPLLLQFFEKAIPLLIAHKQLTLTVFAWLMSI